MSGYTPVFRSVFDGTLHGRWPQTGVWLALLAMADRNGNIDRSPQAIASDIGIGTEQLLECIDEFCAPDVMSRTREHAGRRLELIDSERPWGWRVLNHGKYREKARKTSFDQSRQEDGRNAERMRQRRSADPTRPAPTRADPPSDSDTDINKDRKKEEAVAVAPAAPLGTPTGVNFEAWARWEEYLKLAHSKLMNGFTRPAGMRRLVSLGDAAQQAAVVEHSIANGWKTLNPIRDHGSAPNGRRKTRFEQLREGRPTEVDDDDTFAV